jgi:hypothetical protein
MVWPIPLQNGQSVNRIPDAQWKMKVARGTVAGRKSQAATDAARVTRKVSETGRQYQAKRVARDAAYRAANKLWTKASRRLAVLVRESANRKALGLEPTCETKLRKARLVAANACEALGNKTTSIAVQDVTRRESKAWSALADRQAAASKDVAQIAAAKAAADVATRRMVPELEKLNERSHQLHIRRLENLKKFYITL